MLLPCVQSKVLCSDQNSRGIKDEVAVLIALIVFYFSEDIGQHVVHSHSSGFLILSIPKINAFSQLQNFACLFLPYFLQLFKSSFVRTIRFSLTFLFLFLFFNNIIHDKLSIRPKRSHNLTIIG